MRTCAHAVAAPFASACARERTLPFRSMIQTIASPARAINSAPFSSKKNKIRPGSDFPILVFQKPRYDGVARNFFVVVTVVLM
jgi:hypothetical protein